MSTSGYMLRVDQAQATRSAAPCPGCQHPMSQHRELGYGNPGHKPGEFHCRYEDCECVFAVERRRL